MASNLLQGHGTVRWLKLQLILVPVAKFINRTNFHVARVSIPVFHSLSVGTKIGS